MSDVLAEVLVLAVAVIAVCKVIELFRGDQLSGGEMGQGLSQYKNPNIFQIILDKVVNCRTIDKQDEEEV